jgi:hypothetical protein
LAWLERLQVSVGRGDLLTVDVEVVVSTVMADLRPYGAISRALFARGGEAL